MILKIFQNITYAFPRIIPCLLIKDGGLVKITNLVNQNMWEIR